MKGKRLQEIPDHANVSVNAELNYVAVQENKIKLVYRDHKYKLAAPGRIGATFSLAVTLLLGLVTSEFRKDVWLGKRFWETLFWVGLVLSVVWLTKDIFRLVRSGTSNESGFISDLKKDGESDSN